MSWRERLLNGSFRDAPFHVISARGEGGRNVAIHEFALQDHYVAEDMSGQPDKLQFTAFVVGENYDKARDVLIAALKKPGTGLLVHPYLGVQSIQVTGWDWQISTKQGGYCQFTIRYVLQGRARDVLATDTAAQLNEAVSAASSASLADFAQLDATGAAFIQETLATQARDAVSTLRDLNAKIGTAMQPLDDIANQINDMGEQIANLVNQPLQFAQKAQGVIASVLGAYSEITQAFKAYQHLSALFSAPSTGATDTPSQRKIAANRAAMSSMLVQQSLLAMTDLLSADEPFSRYNDAIEVRDTLLADIEQQITRDNVSYAQYSVLATLQNAISQRIDEIAPGLEQVTYIQLNTVLPALVVAHRYYGTAAREDELVSRNRIKHPLFMPAGVALEVLL